MAQKAWVVTSQSFDGTNVLSEPQLVEHIPARKKISFIDDYLCDLLEDMLDEQDSDTPYNDQLVRSKISHPSGTEVILEYAPLRLHVVLQEIGN